MKNIRSNINNDIEEFVLEAQEDYIGFWQIFGVVKDRTNNFDIIRSEVFYIVETLLGRGFLAGDLKGGCGFEPWGQQEKGAVVSRILKEWQDLGHDPNIGDICWFDLPG